MIIGFIGAGAMGGALIEGFIKSGIEYTNIIASVKTMEKKDYLEKNLGIKVYTDNRKVASEADVLFIAVKPYMVSAVAAEISSSIKVGATIVSVAASVSKRDLSRLFNGSRIVRIMPNTPVKTCNGFISVVEAENKVVENGVVELLKRVGMVKVIKEEQIHAYNAIAGCSPAFMYILIEAMSDAGVLMGIDRKTSIEMAAQVFKGTGAMVLESGKHPAHLKDGVCTPGGLTIKGVEVLEEKCMRSGLIESIIASYNKSIESEKK